VSAAYTQLAAARHEAGRGSRGQGPIAKALAFNCALREAAFQSCAGASPLGRVVSLCDGQCPDLDHALRQVARYGEDAYYKGLYWMAIHFIRFLPFQEKRSAGDADYALQSYLLSVMALDRVHRHVKLHC
jgi:hypothetical protein